MKTMFTCTKISLAMVLVGASSLSMAQTDTMTVSAEVQESCLIAAADLNFDTVNVLSGEDVEATSDISVTCTSGADYEVGLNGGGTGDVAARTMSDGGTGTLNYALYSDAGHTDNWGETPDGDMVTETGNGDPQTHTVYGRVPQGQNSVAAGVYSDAIIATVSY